MPSAFTAASLLSAFAACGLAFAAAAQAHVMTAPNSPSARNEWKGATTGLGSSHRFPTMAAARRNCISDTIVWSDGYHLTYYLAGSKYYGNTKYGFYACKAEADSAGFQAVTQ